MPDVGKVWQVNLNGSSVKVEDLPLTVVDRITKEANVSSWFEVVNTPLLDLQVAGLLITAAAEHLGVPAPENPTIRQVVDLFSLVDDTVPAAAPPVDIPLVQGGPVTVTPGSPS